MSIKSYYADICGSSTVYKLMLGDEVIGLRVSIYNQDTACIDYLDFKLSCIKSKSIWEFLDKYENDFEIALLLKFETEYVDNGKSMIRTDYQTQDEYDNKRCIPSTDDTIAVEKLLNKVKLFYEMGVKKNVKI